MQVTAMALMSGLPMATAEAGESFGASEQVSLLLHFVTGDYYAYQRGTASQLLLVF